MGPSEQTGGIQMYGAIWTPLSLTKHAFFVLCMYSMHPNIIKTGCPYMFGHPPYVCMPPVCFAHMFGHPHMFAPPCLDAPVSLGVPYVWTPLCMVGCPLCLDTPLYVAAPYM